MFQGLVTCRNSASYSDSCIMHMYRHADCEIQRKMPRAITTRPYETIASPTECIRQVWGAANRIIVGYPPGARQGITAERCPLGGASAVGMCGRMGTCTGLGRLPSAHKACLKTEARKIMGGGERTTARFLVYRASVSDFTPNAQIPKHTYDASPGRAGTQAGGGAVAER